MSKLYCTCGQTVYFDNHSCGNCGRALAFDPSTLRMQSEEWPGAGLPFCGNRANAVQCNWLSDSLGAYCLSCQLSRVIPTLGKIGNEAWWRQLEAAKRVLIRDLLRLGLPVQSGELSFEFMEDRRTNPLVDEEFVLIGHRAGTITINAAEADDLFRESMRLKMGEPVRTLLGHMRHESGHYYFNVLLDEQAKDAARVLFGDERADYETALAEHYQVGPRADWQSAWISPYASAHPSEDWAECWSHYLQIRAAIDVAEDEGWVVSSARANWYESGGALLRSINEFCRSLGLADAYPYVWNEPVRRKIDYIHRTLETFVRRVCPN